MERTVYVRLFSTVAGLVLVGLGLAGFVTDAGFRSPELTSNLFGILPVNGWANALHLVTGLTGLGLARPLPRLFAFVAGVFFLALGCWGVLAPDGQLLFGVLPAARPVNLFNLVLGTVGLLALFGSHRDRIGTALSTQVTRLRRRQERRRRARKRRRAVRRRANRHGPGT